MARCACHFLRVIIPNEPWPFLGGACLLVAHRDISLRRRIWSLLDLGRVKTLYRRIACQVAGSVRYWLCPHRGHERTDAHNVHDAGEIVSEHVQGHL